MRDTNGYKDLIGGAILMALGLFMAIYSVIHYELGRAGQMGPGMFPAGLGCILVAIGLLVGVPAFGRLADWPRADWRPLVAITLALAAFAIMTEEFGLVLSVISVTVIASLADGRLGLLRSAGLGVILAISSMLIFIAALGMPLVAFRWP